MGSLVVPFVLIPLLGSPVVVAVLAARSTRDSGSSSRGACRAARRSRDRGGVGVVVAIVIVATALRPGVARPARARRTSSRRRPALRIARGRDRLRPGRPDHVHAGALGRRHLDDAADGRREADAGPAVDRPADSKRALVVAFGMGSAFRGALIAGSRTDARRARPERAQDVRVLLPRRRRGPGRPERAGHHHRRAQPPRADRRALRHHHHRPAAADRELRRLRHLVEGVLRGRAGPPDRPAGS